MKYDRCPDEMIKRVDVEEAMQRLIRGATLVGTRGFGEAVIRHMSD